MTITASIPLIFAIVLLVCSFIWAIVMEKTVSSLILAVWAMAVLLIFGRVIS